jgi:hypothetical protein
MKTLVADLFPICKVEVLPDQSAAQSSKAFFAKTCLQPSRLMCCNSGMLSRSML